MRTDADRFRFIAEHKLSIVWYDHGPSISWREQRPEPGKLAQFHPLARAATLEEAIDEVIDRWEKQHGKHWP